MAVSRRSARPRFTLFLLILASLTLITLDLSGGGTIPGVRGRARDIFQPVQSAASAITRPITDFFRGAFDYRHLENDNSRLHAEVAQLQANQIQDQTLVQDNKDLTALLKLPYLGDIRVIAADVAAGPESNFQLTMVIDRGSGAGILKGMPVVSAAGLVGRVIEVSDNQSTVLLLTDASANVGVRFAPAGAVGVATGQGVGHPLDVTLVDPSAVIPMGADAVTSGLAGSPYPPGIPVGVVNASNSRPGVQAHAIELNPIVDLTGLKYVDVVVWTPQTPGDENSTQTTTDPGGVASTGQPPVTSAPPSSRAARGGAVSPDSPWLRGGAVLALVFLVHEALLRGLRFDGVRPDLLLGAGIVAAIVAGPEAGALFAFVAALLGDLFVNTPFGLSSLVACVVAFIVGGIHDQMRSNQRWAIPFLAAVASAAAEVLWASVAEVLGLSGLLHPRLLLIAGVVAAVNAIAALPLAAALRWAFVGAGDAAKAGPGLPRGFAA